jgi:hypothetical protein
VVSVSGSGPSGLGVGSVRSVIDVFSPPALSAGPR